MKFIEISSTKHSTFNSINQNFPTNSLKTEQQASISSQTVNRAGQRRLRTETLSQKAISDELVNILVKYGNNADGIPALHYAIKQQDENAVKLLLKHGADPNAQSRANFVNQYINQGSKGPLTAIDFASAYGTPEIIKILIANGARVNIAYSPDNMSWDHLRLSPLHFALQQNNLENINVLIAEGADKYYAAWMQHKTGNQHVYSTIHYASLLGNIEALKIFLQTTEDANYLGPYQLDISPLVLALQSGNVDVARFLLESGASPNLGRSMITQRYNIEKIIPHVHFINPAYVSHDHIFEILSLLLDYELDINMRDNGGRTLLMNLIERYEFQKAQQHPPPDNDHYLPYLLCIETILRKGAIVEAKDPWGVTAFSIARSPEIKELLNKHGVN